MITSVTNGQEQGLKHSKTHPQIHTHLSDY